MAISEEQFKNLDRFPQMDHIKTQAQIDTADFGIKATFTTAAAWTPNPKKAPFFLDLPVEQGKIQPLALSRRIANLGLSTIDQIYIS